MTTGGVARDGGEEDGGEGVRAVQRGDEEDAGEDSRAGGATGTSFCCFGARIGDEYLASGVILNQRINRSVVCAREAGGETGPETRDLYMEMSMSGK